MIKQNLKKIPKLIAVFAILITSVLGTNIPIKAKSFDLSQTFKPEWQHTGTTAWGDGTMLYADGELSWCIEPGKRSFVGSNEEVSPSEIGYTQQQMDKLGLIAWYGYRNRNHTETNYFLTQNLIWKVLGSPARLVSNSYPNDTAMKPFFDDVMDKVNNFHDLPSFHGKTYTVNIGDTLSIPDTKNVLNGLNIKSITGGSATISGNTLKITPNGKTDKMLISFNRGMSPSQTETNFIVRGNGTDEYGRAYQSISKLTGSDPYSAYVNIKVNRFGSLEIAKKNDSGKYIAGTTFKLSYNADMSDPVGTYTTVTNGKVKIDELLPKKIYIQEISVPEDLVVDKTIHSITIKVNETATYTATNKRVKGRIEIVKEDSETGNIVQGEGTLDGAVYGLYAKENIIDPADNSIQYTKDTKITQVTITDGKASIENLYLGKYYVKEINASHGYTLDSTIYPITISYANQDTPIVHVKQTVKEKVISQAFSIIKISDNDSGEADILKGVEFTIKAKKDIDQVGSWEKAPVAKNSLGQTASILVTDEKGYALSDELPYGTYVIRETKTPDDHYQVPDFTIVVNKDSREPQPWRIFNDEKFHAVVAIVKQDAETGKTIKLAGATFKIKNLDTNDYVGSWVWNPLPHYVDSWTTDESGSVLTDNVLEPGKYQLEEVKAPDGYTIQSEPVKFTITSSGIFETLPDGKTPVITVKMKDTSVKGKLKLLKEGEVLKGIEKDDKGNIQFTYETRPLKNVTFTIYAKETIFSPDHQKDILFEKDEFVEKITSSSDGIAESKELPLGRYYIKEVQTQDGYVLDGTKIDVTLEYDNQNQEIVIKDIGNLVNKRKRVDAKAFKKDAQTNIGVAGATISIFANRDIYNIDGEIIVKEGTCLEKAITDENGYIQFKIDLPRDITPEYAIMPIKKKDNEFKHTGNVNGLFYMMETKAPLGYFKGEDIRCYFDAKLDANKNPKEAHELFESTFYNDKTEIEFLKKDKTNGQMLTGSTLQVLDKNKKVVAQWVSSNKPHKIRGLRCNESYTLREVKPASGYVSADDVEFVVKDILEEQCIEMYDDITKIDVSKLSEETKKPLKGNTLAIYDMHGKQVDTWISNQNVHRIEKLEVGKTYAVKELKACSGYTKAADITFVVKDTKDIQNIVMTNRLQSIVKTGDTTDLSVEIAFFITAVGVFIFLAKNMKEKHNS